MVDSCDQDLVDSHKWHMAGGKGGKYLATVIDGKTTYLHRLIAARMGLPLVSGRSGVSVDHKNGNKLDNRRSNLTIKTRSEQMLNISDGLRKTNTSGHRGVSYRKRRKPWSAYVQVNGKTKSLGSYATFEEAVAARKAFDSA